jgi:hypothetical protein
MGSESWGGGPLLRLWDLPHLVDSRVRLVPGKDVTWLFWTRVLWQCCRKKTNSCVTSCCGEHAIDLSSDFGSGHLVPDSANN